MKFFVHFESVSCVHPTRFDLCIANLSTVDFKPNVLMLHLIWSLTGVVGLVERMLLKIV